MRHLRDTAKVLIVLFIFVVHSAESRDPSENFVPARGQAFDGSELVENSCEVLATNEGEDPGLRSVPGMYVLGRSEDNPLVLMSTDDVKINGVVCWRSEAKFSATDYLIPERLEVPFYVKTESGDEATDRTVVLEKIGTSYRVRVLSGPLFTDSEKEAVIGLLQYFESLEPSKGA